MAEGRGSGLWLVVGVLVLGALFALLAQDRSAAPMGAGSPAPAFVFERVGGGPPVSLAALRGRVVFVNFWATWCKPCEDEMPAMERLYRKLAGADFEMVAISVDDGYDEVAEFQARLGLSFPITHDPDKAVASAYQAHKYPETFLVDREGVVVTRFIGPRDWDAQPYVDRIRALIAGDAL